MGTQRRFLFTLAAVTAVFPTIVTSYNPLLTYTIRFKQMTLRPNISGEYIIDQYKEKQFINANISINSDEIIDTVVGVFHRCNPEGNNCEYFQTWKLVDICPKLEDKNQIWYDWYGAFHPPMLCPLNKVHYQVRNGTFDINKAILLYPDATNYWWKVIQKLYVGEKFIGSYTLELTIFGYRKKTKSLLSNILPFKP